MENKKSNKNLEKKLLSIFKAYITAYLFLEETKSKNHAKKIQKIAK